MKDTRMIFPEPFFIAAWKSQTITAVDLAAIYGTSRAAVYRAANRFGLGQKNPVPVPEIIPDPRPNSYEDDLVWSKGRWSVLSEIAETYGMTLIKVQADFHKLRMAVAEHELDDAE